jgi:hypothetical protein
LTTPLGRVSASDPGASRGRLASIGIRAAFLDTPSQLLNARSRLGDIWHRGAHLDTESLLLTARSRLGDI